MASIIESLNERMPNLINKDGQEYKAIFGQYPFVPEVEILNSEDYNCGAIANELEYLRAYIDYVTASVDVSTLESLFLEKLIYFFLELERIYDEDDDSLRNRFLAYIRRNGNLRWCTGWSLRDIFSYFFNADDIYILENYVFADEITDGDFELVTGGVFDNWNESEAGSSTVDPDITEKFQNARCCKFSIDVADSIASVDQTVIGCTAEWYRLSLFYKDDNLVSGDIIRIIIFNSTTSKYYDFSDDTWNVALRYKEIPNVGTAYVNYHIDINMEAGNVNVKIASAGAFTTVHAFYVDRVEMGPWKDYPTVKVLIVTAGVLGAFMSLWGDTVLQFVDRGDCESTTAPMLTPETVPILSNALWARDAAQYYKNTYSYKLTKNVAAGTAAYATLNDNESTVDMHGLAANTEYTFMARVRVPSTGGPLGTEVSLKIEDYLGTWEISSQACVNTYDSWQYVRVVKTLRASCTGVNIKFEIHSDAAINEYVNADQVIVAEGDIGDLETVASYFDNDFISGPGGGYTSGIYQEMLDKAREAGVYGILEFVARE